LCRWACALRGWACLTAAESQPAHPCPPEARFSAPFLISLCLNAFPSPHSSFRMVVTPYMRGFDRPMAFVLMGLLSTCAAAGGFAWKWGANAQSCTAACSDAGLVCVKEFTKIGDQAAFEAASNRSDMCGGGYGDEPGDPAPYQYGDGSGASCWWHGPQIDIDPDWLRPDPTCDAAYGTPSRPIFRLCSCQCAAGSFSPSDTQPGPCPRYDTIPTLSFHLRLSKARPTQLFLSMFFSRPWPSSVSDSPNPLIVVSQANGKMVRDSLSAKTAWPASSRPRLVRHQTRAKTALSTPTPLLPRVYTMTARLTLVLPAPVSL